MRRTIGDLLAEVPEGQSRIFEAIMPNINSDRFVEVVYNWNYDAILSWKNRALPGEGPWMGSRRKSRIGLSGLVEPRLTFERDARALVDFYMPSPGVHVISENLLAIIERSDPGSLEVRPVIVEARDARVDMNMVMPTRLLEAVDPDQCDINIVAERLDMIWLQRVRFPHGAVFASQIDESVHNFADIDVRNRWFWSTELVSTAKNAGIRGIRTKKPAGRVSEQFDEF